MLKGIFAKMKKNNFFIVQVLVFLLSFLVLCVFIERRIDNLLDSDISTQLLLSKHLFEEGSFLSRNWFYATEIRIIGYQLIFTPLFWFTTDFHVVRIVGTIIYYIILLVALYYFCVQFNAKKYFYVLGTIFMLPFSTEYFDFMLINVNYIPIMSAVLLSLGLYMQIIRCGDKWKTCGLLIILGVLSLLSGMGGMRQLYLLYAPAFMGVLILCWMSRKDFVGQTGKAIVKMPYIRLITVSIWALIWAGAGYLFNNRYLAKRYFYKTYENRQWEAFSFADVEDMIDGWLSVFGYTRGELFSVSALQNGVCFLLVAAIVMALYQIMKKHGDHGVELKFLTCFVLSGVLCLFIVNNFTSIANSARYGLQILLICFPILFCYLGETNISKMWKYFVMLSLTATIMVASVCRYGQYAEVDKTEDIKAVAAFIEENEYFEGYATFWNANIMTELSNGVIETWTLQNMDFSSEITDVNDMFMEWCQPVEHKTTHPEGKTFLVMTKEEGEKSLIDKRVKDSYVVYQNDTYDVYGFSDYDNMISVLQSD